MNDDMENLPFLPPEYKQTKEIKMKHISMPGNPAHLNVVCCGVGTGQDVGTAIRSGRDLCPDCVDYIVEQLIDKKAQPQKLMAD